MVYASVPSRKMSLGIGGSPCSNACRRGRSSAAGDRVAGSAASLEPKTETETGPRPVLVQGHVGHRDDARGRGGGGDLGVWCENGEGQRK
jgi:hypothetical protein